MHEGRADTCVPRTPQNCIFCRYATIDKNSTHSSIPKRNEHEIINKKIFNPTTYCFSIYRLQYHNIPAQTPAPQHHTTHEPAPVGQSPVKSEVLSRAISRGLCQIRFGISCFRFESRFAGAAFMS